MMKFNKIVTRSKKRVGRGMGSGKGSHTVGRGQKGQRSNTDIHILFEGLKMKKSFLKRLPLQRGKGKFHAKGGPAILNIRDLEVLPTNSKITLDLLIKEGLVEKDRAEKYGVKILAGGETTKKFTFEVPTSKALSNKEKEVAPEEEVKASR